MELTTKEKVLFDSVHLTISDNGSYLHLIWRGFVPSAHFRPIAEEILHAIRKSGTTRILSDNRLWKIISPNDYNWAAQNWFPQAERLGVQKMASVLSGDIFNRIAERDIEAMADIHRMVIRHFEETSAAEGWLLS